MREYDKTKYKACLPGETVDRIKRILKENGIETEETWTESGVGTICSVRITVKGMSVGQNGKGTSHEYALASGYAEFMERLQTGYLFPECLQAPRDREWLEPSEIIKEGGSLLEGSFRQIRKTQEQEYLPENLPEYLQGWTFDAKKGKIAAIAFRNLESAEKCYLPESILRAFYFTNGSCAGNTREEALIQGLSEMAERYACIRIMVERLTPPLIPEEKFADIPLLKNAVDTIRSMGGYDLRIMDASCDMGLPVVAAVLSDKKHAKTVLRFGAHPRFEVALERCLTEILQGRHIDRLEISPVFDYAFDAASTDILNRFNFMKAAYGQFPVRIYGSTPSWEFRPFEEAPEDIPGQLAFMKALYARLGWDVYVRDCSFLGFPSYQLVIPGKSMVFDFGTERQKEKEMHFQFREILKKKDRYSYEDIRLVRRLAVLKRGFLIENSFALMSGMPVYPKFLGLELDAGLLAGLTSLALFDRKHALEFFTPYSFYTDGRVTGVYPLVQLLKGRQSKEICDTLKCICEESQLEEAKDVLHNPEKYLPVMTCPDCGVCPLKEDCAVTDAMKEMMKK